MRIEGFENGEAALHNPECPGRPTGTRKPDYTRVRPD